MGSQMLSGNKYTCLCLAQNYCLSGSNQYFLSLYTKNSDSVKELEFLSHKLFSTCYHITADALKPKQNKTNRNGEILIMEEFKFSWNCWNKEIY